MAQYSTAALSSQNGCDGWIDIAKNPAISHIEFKRYEYGGGDGNNHVYIYFTKNKKGRYDDPSVVRTYFTYHEQRLIEKYSLCGFTSHSLYLTDVPEEDVRSILPYLSDTGYKNILNEDPKPEVFTLRTGDAKFDAIMGRLSLAMLILIAVICFV